MLSEQEKQKIEEELSHYPQKAAVVPEALKIVQKHRGWVSDEGLHDVAQFLGLPVSELESVATFYNLIYRRPVGRHVILICDSVTCWIMGYEGLRERLTMRLGVVLGETTTDGRFTLLPVPCLGGCDQAPAMMIDEDFHALVDPDKIDEILEQYE